MSTKNKKSVASQALLEMDSITSAIKEESKNSLLSLLKESVVAGLRESCKDEEDEDKPEIYDENDAEYEKDDEPKDAKSDVDENGDEGMMAKPQKSTDAPQGIQGDDMGTQNAPMAKDKAEADADVDVAEPEGEGDAMADYSDYKVGDNTYDLTGEKDYTKVAKVYKLLNDDDNIVVKQDGNTIQLKDGETGTEFIIDLGADDEDASAEVVKREEEPETGLNESNIAGFDDDEEDSEDFDDVESDETTIGSQTWDGEMQDKEDDLAAKIDALQAQLDALREKEMPLGVNEQKKTRGPMKERKETLFEVDLGYTDDYQDKDPIAGLSNNEPSKSGKSWHKGVPTGTEKPWAGDTTSKNSPCKDDGCVNEEDIPTDMGDSMDSEEPVDEATNVGGAVQQRTSAKSHIPSGRKNYGPGVKHHVSTEANYDAVVAENKKLKKQVKELTEAVLSIRKNLKESYVTNSNLGKIAKLFLENTTSQSEKVEIVNRFANEAKTIEQSKALYESINRELKKSQKTLNINESVSSVNSSKAINETKVYRSPDLLKTIDFMNRVLNC